MTCGCGDASGGTYTRRMLTGPQKTDAIAQLAIAGAEGEPLIREAATRLVHNLPRGAHAARLERLHQWVRDSVPYHREPIEMLHRASHVAIHGGDCDDHAILMGALAWALKYPFFVRAVGNANFPGHYTQAIGFPESASPHGDEKTTWIEVETTIPAHFGEPVERAARRLAHQAGP